MTNPSEIERVVMRRVRLVRVLNLAISPATGAMLLAVLALWGIGHEVWVAKVLENAPGDATRLPSFYLAAFEHTRLTVQALTLATLGSLIYLARAAAKPIAGLLTAPLHARV